MFQRNFKRLMVGTTVLVALGGCTSNPYPGDGQYFTNKPTTNSVLPPYGLDVDDVVEMREGVQKDIPIKGWVPAPGKALITVDGLPNGATFPGTGATPT